MRILLILALLIIGGGFHYYKTSGYGNEEVIGGFIVMTFIMSFLLFFYLRIEEKWNDFIHKYFNYNDANNLSWFIPLMLFIAILIFLTPVIVKNYSFIFPLFFS